MRGILSHSCLILVAQQSWVSLVIFFWLASSASRQSHCVVIKAEHGLTFSCIILRGFPWERHLDGSIFSSNRGICLSALWCLSTCAGFQLHRQSVALTSSWLAPRLLGWSTGFQSMLHTKQIKFVWSQNSFPVSLSWFLGELWPGADGSVSELFSHMAAALHHGPFDLHSKLCPRTVISGNVPEHVQWFYDSAASGL